MNLCEDVKQTIIELIDDLRRYIFDGDEDAQGDLMLVEMFFKNMHEERVMNHVVLKILPHRAKIEKKDISYFKEKMGLFEGLPSDRVAVYSNMISDGRLDKDDLDTIWEYLDTITQLAINYRKDK